MFTLLTGESKCPPSALRSTRELHRETLFPRGLLWIELIWQKVLKSRKQADFKTCQPGHNSIVTWFVLSHRLPSTLSEVRRQSRRKFLRYSQSNWPCGICQELFQITAFLLVFSRILLILKYLTHESAPVLPYLLLQAVDKSVQGQAAPFPLIVA